MLTGFEFNYIHYIYYIIAGALGGFCSEYMNHGCIELPRKHDGKLYLGSIGGIIIGAIAGIIGDSNPINAFIWGLGGISIVRKMMCSSNSITLPVICNTPPDEDKPNE